MEDLGAHADSLVEVGGAHRHDHELLEVDVVVGVTAAVEDVHHGHRQHTSPRAPEVAIERQAHRVGRRPGHRHGGAERSIGAEVALVLGPVQVGHELVQVHLVARVLSHQRRSDPLDHVLDRLADAFAEVAVAGAVTQLQGLVFAGGGSRRHGRAPESAAVEAHLDFDGRVPARIQDFPGDNLRDRGHGKNLLVGPKAFSLPAEVQNANVDAPRRGVNRRGSIAWVRWRLQVCHGTGHARQARRHPGQAVERCETPMAVAYEGTRAWPARGSSRCGLTPRDRTA